MTELDIARQVTIDIINENADIGIITRQNLVSNGMGGLIPAGDPVTHTEVIRIFMESMTDWHFAPSEKGIVNGQTPALLAEFDADIQFQDTLEWRGKTFTVGNVTKPQRFGGVVSVQAPLTEISEAI